MTSGRKSKARRQATPPPVGKQQGISTRAWLIGGGAAAVVVLAIVLAVALTRGGGSGQTMGPEGIPVPTASNATPASRSRITSTRG